MEKKTGAINMYQCGELMCDDEYIVENPGPWGRYKEHLKEPSSIHAHNLQTGHNAAPDNFNIVGRVDYGLARIIKESIYIRVNNPTLNRNIGKFNLNHIWNRVLLNTSDLTINSSNGHAHRTYISRHAQSIPTNMYSHRTIGHSGHQNRTS